MKDEELQKQVHECIDLIKKAAYGEGLADGLSLYHKSGGWIPVGKMLPEVGERVLVTAYGRTCYAMLESVDGNNGFPVFRLQDSLKERVVCETTAHNEFTSGRIIAWMRIPAPYIEKSEEKDMRTLIQYTKLSTKTSNALRRARIETLEDLKRMTPAQIKNIRNIGPNALKEITELLSENKEAENGKPI